MMAFFQLLGGGILLVVWIFFSVVSWFIYHSIFDVTYFGSGGCVQEISVCCIIGLVITGIIASPFMWILSLF